MNGLHIAIDRLLGIILPTDFSYFEKLLCFGILFGVAIFIIRVIKGD